MKRIGDDVRRELRRFGPQSRLADVLSAWPAAVGSEITRNACPARLARDGTLHVATSSSAWAFELTNLQRVIVDRLRGALGDDAPRRVVFAPGPVPDMPTPDASSEGREAPAVSASARARGAELAAAVSDEELARRIAAAAAAAHVRMPSDRPF